MVRVKYTREQIFAMEAVDIYKIVLRKDVLKKFPNGFWKRPEAEQDAVKCIQFLIEDILKWTDEDIKKKLIGKVFIDNALGGMMKSVFYNSPYKAINSVYPDKFKEWELQQVPKSFWTLEKGIEATRWLIEEKLKWTDEDIKNKLSQKTFCENRLSGMMSYAFKGSTYKAINSVYPERFKEWELKNTPINFWTIEKGIETTKWLIEEKLKWSDEDVENKLSVKTFYENGLSSMIVKLFNGSPYKALNTAYPNKYSRCQFKTKY